MCCSAGRRLTAIRGADSGAGWRLYAISSAGRKTCVEAGAIVTHKVWLQHVACLPQATQTGGSSLCTLASSQSSPLVC